MVDFDISHLRYFEEAAKEGSMSKAAANLYVSQQALSKGIRVLENSLGADLFIRKHAGIELTSFGRFFRERSRQVLQDIDSCQAAFDDYHNDIAETVSIGIIPMCLKEKGGSLDVTQIARFQARHPRASFEFMEMSADEAYKGLVDHTLDFGIGGLMHNDAFQAISLGTFPMCAVVSKESPLAFRKSLNLADLAHGEVVIPYGNSRLEQTIVELAKLSGTSIHISPLRMDAEDPGKLVTSPHLFLIKPIQHARRRVANDHVAIIPLYEKTGEPLSISLDLNFRKGKPFTAAEQELVDFITGFYRKPGALGASLYAQAAQLPE